MKVRRSDILLIGALILIAAIPTLVQSNIRFLGINQQDESETTINEFSQEQVQISRLAADRLPESDVFDAPEPFNAVVVQWEPAEDGTGSLLDPFFLLEIRTGTDGDWSDWQAVQASADLTQEGDTLVAGDMIFVDGGAGTDTQVQLRTGQNITLPRILMTYIDSTGGPTTEELILAMDQLRSASPAAFLDENVDNPRPYIISRDVWCTSDLCRPDEGNSGNGCVDSDRLRYVNDLSHMVVHHTVTSNDATNWAPIVRAIWSYHAFSRCWGDIGYNYLIDPYGNIYEGHRGGENVMGTHAGNINADSMGVALLGTFTEPGPPYNGIQPPNAMTDSLVELLSWKADQEQIDPWGASFAPSLGSGRPNLMGHRDAHGTTSCPGQQAHDMLPEIRGRVAAKLDFVQDRIFVDELTSSFGKSNANWYTGAYNCGFNGHAWFTFSTTSSFEAVNNATWSFEVPVDGYYVVDAHIPFCNTANSETTSAYYEIRHATGETEVKVDQDEHVGLWAKLGSYEFKAGETHTVYLSDFTNDNGRGVWFDAIRLTPASGDDLPSPQLSLEGPEDGAWLAQREIEFSWAAEEFFSSQEVELRLSTNISMTDIVQTTVVSSDVTSTIVTLDEANSELYWQLSTQSGFTTSESEVWRLSVDDEPPTTEIRVITRDEAGIYSVGVDASDGEGIGVTDYTIESRILNSRSSWIPLVENTTASTIAFSPPDPNVGYEFRVIGRDALGNVENVSDDAKGTTEDAVVVQPALYLPLIMESVNVSEGSEN
ncbi:MAG: N-acetylmuramoyl-L-alanine amidase [Chloroflexota bacterium]